MPTYIMLSYITASRLRVIIISMYLPMFRLLELMQ